MPDGPLGADDLDGLELRITPTDGVGAEDVTVQLDGCPVAVEPDGRDLVLRPGPLEDGWHDLVVDVVGSGPFGTAATTEHSFTVDTTPSVVELPERFDAGSLRGDLTVSGTVQGAEQVTVNGDGVETGADRFEVSLPAPPATVDVLAVDAAGNEPAGRRPCTSGTPRCAGCT